jgi:hypothetical protein
MEVFALGGGTMTVGGLSVSGQLLPWHWLQGLPGLAQVLPWRFSVVADGAAAAVLAFSLDRARAAVVPRAQGSPRWRRGILTGVALLAVVPLVPLPYPAEAVPQVPAGWQATATRLRLPPGAPVLVLPFPSDGDSQPMRWQADTGWPQSMIGGYFLGPNATGQAVFYSYNHDEQTDVARYLDSLGKGQRPRSGPSVEEIRAVFAYWRPAAIVVVTPRPPIVRVLTQLFGRPASHVGEVLGWRLPR